MLAEDPNIDPKSQTSQSNKLKGRHPTSCSWTLLTILCVLDEGLGSSCDSAGSMSGYLVFLQSCPQISSPSTTPQASLQPPADG